jgi:hypothetical protein
MEYLKEKKHSFGGFETIADLLGWWVLCAFSFGIA